MIVEILVILTVGLSVLALSSLVVKKATHVPWRRRRVDSGWANMISQDNKPAEDPRDRALFLFHDGALMDHELDAILDELDTGRVCPWPEVRELVWPELKTEPCQCGRYQKPKAARTCPACVEEENYEQRRKKAELDRLEAEREDRRKKDRELDQRAMEILRSMYGYGWPSGGRTETRMESVYRDIRNYLRDEEAFKDEQLRPAKEILKSASVPGHIVDLGDGYSVEYTVDQYHGPITWRDMDGTQSTRAAAELEVLDSLQR